MGVGVAQHIPQPAPLLAWGWGLGTHLCPHLGAAPGGCHPLDLRDRMWVLLGQCSGTRWGFVGLRERRPLHRASLALPASPLPGHRGCLTPLPACQGAPPAWQGWLQVTLTAPGLSPGMLGTAVGPGCALPRAWIWWWVREGGGGGGLKQAECACMCVCVCMHACVCKATSSGHVMPCHLLPGPG